MSRGHTCAHTAARVAMKRTGSEWMAVAWRYVDYCCRAETVPRVDELARSLSTSREGLTRAFCETVGLTPADAFRRMQLHRAKHLLANTDLSTAVIARATAFGSPRAFYRVFLRSVGTTPTTYRLRARQRRT